MVNFISYLRATALMALLALLLVAIIFIKPIQPINSQTKDAATITFLGLAGDADCILISHQNQHVMIDTGETRDADYIINFLKENKINTLQSLILTHPDQDHIGGATTILKAVSVQQVVQSSLQKNNALQNNLNATMKDQQINPVVPQGAMELGCGGIKLQIFAPKTLFYNNDNNYSLIILANYGKTNILLAGDAEKKRLEEVLSYQWPPINIYKVAHHGRANKLSAPFVEKIQPQVAIITAAQGEKEVIDALQNCGSQIYYTSGGDITFAITPNSCQKIK